MSTKDILLNKIKILNETTWENKANKSKIDDWLNNFAGDKEQIHALFLLSQFIYFGSTQMRYLLKSLYRDLYKYRLVEGIRKSNNDTIDTILINQEFAKQQRKTRFLGVGNPSESGVHLLYFFRQENKIPKDLFINPHEIFDRSDPANIKLNLSDVEEYVFIDDFCGSGTQAKKYSSNIVEDLKRLSPNCKISYLMLFASKDGKTSVKSSTKFDYVEAVFELDRTFKCFDVDSRFFVDSPNDIDKDYARVMSEKYGLELYKTIIKREDNTLTISAIESIANLHKLGYKDSQNLIGFHHNTPDNTLPIIWYDESDFPWKPIFRRYNKKYGT